MSSEKKSVLIALCVSAVMAIALFLATAFAAAKTGEIFPAAVIFLFFAIFFLYALNRANELSALNKEAKDLADYEASHLRKMPDVPITRIARIVERQRRNSAQLC